MKHIIGILLVFIGSLLLAVYSCVVLCFDQVREAWAKVMSAELSEEAVVREAQQRAELLCHRSSEGRAQLEEARREKQRMTAEYEGLAKQDWPGGPSGDHPDFVPGALPFDGNLLIFPWLLNDFKRLENSNGLFPTCCPARPSVSSFLIGRLNMHIFR